MFIILDILAPLVGAVLIGLVMTMPLALAASHIDDLYLRLSSNNSRQLRAIIIIGLLSLVWLCCAYGIAWFAGSTLYLTMFHNPKFM